MSPIDRARYLARSAYNAILRQEAEADERVRVGDEVAEHWDAKLDTNLSDPGAGNQLDRLIEKDLLAKARSLNLRDGERRILELVMTGKATSWAGARDMADLPDSYRVGLLKKLKTLSK